MISTRACLAGALLFAGACIPVRDNHQDPSIAPEARLVFVSTGLGEVCPPLTVADSYDSVSLISRGQCLALDARNSFDPQGDYSIAQFRFSLPAGLGYEATTVVTTNGLLVLDPGYRRSLPTGVELEFGVRVSDREDNFGKDTAVVKLTNERPVASIASGFTVPEGGLPWALGVPVPVTFDATKSSDADGDPMRFCWTVPGAAETCLPGPAGARFTYDVPITAGRHAVQLRIKDGETGEVEDGNSKVSRTAWTSVWVENTPLWAIPYSGDASILERIDTSAFASILPSTFATTLVNRDESAGGPAIIAELSGPRRLRAYAYDAFTPGADLTVTGNPPSALELLPDPARSRFWAVRKLGGDVFRANRYLLEPDFDILEDGTSPDFVLSTERGNLQTICEDGSLWAASMADAGLVSFFEPAAPITESIDVPSIALGCRPGGSEMWALVQEPDTAKINVYAGPASGAPVELDVGLLSAFALDWIDETEFWLATAEYGLLRIDAGILQSSLTSGLSGETSLVLATTAVVDVTILSAELIRDPLTGELWSSFARIAPDLSLHLGGTPSFIDPDGYPWVKSGGLRRVRSPAISGLLESYEVAESGSFPSPDVTRGSVWIVTNTPAAILEITSEGRPGKRFPVVNLPEGPSVVPLYTDFVVSPDGRVAYAVDQASSDYQVQKIDLTQTPPNVTDEYFFDDANDEYLYSYAGLLPSASATSSFVWSAAGSSTELYPVRIESQLAVRDTGVTISSQFGHNIGLARSLVDDGVCIATLERTFVSGSTFTLTLRLYRALPGQAAVQLDFRQFNYVGGAGGSAYDLPFVAATRAPDGGEMCWTGHVRTTNPATNEILTVFGAQAGMGTIRSFSYTGLAGEDVRSVVPIGPDEVIYLRNTSIYRRHTPVAGVLTGETAINTLDPLGNTSQLVSAEAENY